MSEVAHLKVEKSQNLFRTDFLDNFLTEVRGGATSDRARATVRRQSLFPRRFSWALKNQLRSIIGMAPKSENDRSISQLMLLIVQSLN